MSVEYKAICDTCGQYLNLDKFDMWCASYTRPEKEDIDDLHERGNFIPMCCRLLRFIQDHNGHKLRIEEWNIAWDTAMSMGYKEIHPLY